MFGRVDFREDGKKKRKRRREKMSRENFLEGVWLGGGEERKKVGPRCFLPVSTIKFSPQNGEKTVGGV